MVKLRQFCALCFLIFYWCTATTECQTVCKDKDNDPCRCDRVDGKGLVDLTFGTKDKPLFSNVNPGSIGASYSYNPCYPYTSSDGSLKGLAASYSIINKDESMSHAVLDGTEHDIGRQMKSTFQMIDGQLAIAYKSQDDISTSTIILSCRNSGSNQLTVDETDFSQNIYNFTLNGPGVCAVPSSPGTGLSGGSILLIICSVLIFIYLVVGVIYQKKRNEATGTDLIPNKDFWASLPGLIKDGMMFLVYKCKGKPPPTYESV